MLSCFESTTTGTVDMSPVPFQLFPDITDTESDSSSDERPPKKAGAAKRPRKKRIGGGGIPVAPPQVRGPIPVPMPQVPTKPPGPPPAARLPPDLSAPGGGMPAQSPEKGMYAMGGLTNSTTAAKLGISVDQC
jgi:hypothetical protein